MAQFNFLKGTGGKIQRVGVPIGRDDANSSPPEFIRLRTPKTIALRYHPKGEAVTFTLAQCEAAIKQAEKEFPDAFPKKEGTTIWYLKHPECQCYKAIGRARDLLFLWRIKS